MNKTIPFFKNYGDVIQYKGAIVHGYKETDDYQGKWYSLITYNNRIYYLCGYYGSCGGCDILEDYRDKISDGITLQQLIDSIDLTNEFTIEEIKKEVADSKKYNDDSYEGFDDWLKKMEKIRTTA